MKIEVHKMDQNTFKRNELLADVVIKGLKSRNMTGYYAASKADALKLALNLIPEGSVVGKGGTMTVEEIGLLDEMRSGRYKFIDREAMDRTKASHMNYDADFFIGSVNAMTDDGILINIDGSSDRVSAYAYGPKKLVLIVGMNKVCPDFDSALKRARNVAAVANAQRFNINTPCKKTGKCMDCKSPDTICCQFLITRFSRDAERIHVILVNDELGY